jgi:hypothetical protein
LNSDCIDITQNLYFATAVLNNKGEEWNLAKNELKKVIDISEQYCRNNVIDVNFMLQTSNDILISIKSDDINKTMDCISKIKNYLKANSKLYSINKNLMLSRLLLSISLLLISFIILVFASINIYQWITNLIVMSVSMASAMLSYYTYSNAILIIASIIENLNIYTINNIELFAGQTLITIFSIINLFLNNLTKNLIKT